MDQVLRLDYASKKLKEYYSMMSSMYFSMQVLVRNIYERGGIGGRLNGDKEPENIKINEQTEKYHMKS